MTTTINPLQIVAGPADIMVDGASPGPTIGGVMIKPSTVHIDVMVDQSTMIIKKLAKERKAQIEFVLAHNTMANLKFALGSSADGFGGNSANPEHALTIAGPGASGLVRTFTFHKASVVGTMDYKNSREEVIGLKVTLDVIADTDKPKDQQLFTFAEAAAA